MGIKDKIKTKMPGMYKVIKGTYKKIIKFKYRERKCHYGTLNPDKIIYIIRIQRSNVGLMSYYTSVLGYVRYALDNGYTPVVDMQNYKNPYLTDEQVGKVNAWELYFKQPSNVSLSDAYKSKNVILCYAGEAPRESAPRRLFDMLQNDKRYYEIASKYLVLNDEMKDYTQTQQKKVFNVTGKILGVSSRGTDMINFPRHSKLPMREELLLQAQEIMKKRNCEYLFLSTEEQSTIDFFKEKLGDKLLFDVRQRYDNFKNSGKKVLTEMKFDRENDAFLQGKEYLNTVVLLSRCDCLFGSLIGSTLGAMCMNGGKYEAVEIFDAGTY